MLESPGALDSRTHDGAGGPLLTVSGLNAWYGESHVLHGVAFEVLPGALIRRWSRIFEQHLTPFELGASRMERCLHPVVHGSCVAEVVLGRLVGSGDGREQAEVVGCGSA